MTTEHRNPNQVTADWVTGIVCAYVSNNSVSAHDLPALIASVHASVAGLHGIKSDAVAKPDLTVSEAQIRKSITPDALISFIDGKPYKMLKRHLRTHGLDQQGYRERYGLPANYPMVAPSYSTRRVELSRSFQAARSKRL